MRATITIAMALALAIVGCCQPAEQKAGTDFNPEVEAEAVWKVRLAVQDALNRADTTALMALFAEDSSFIMNDQKFVGWEAIKNMHEDLFEENPGIKLEFSRTAIHFPTPEVAVEDVTYIVTVPEGPAINGRDTSVLVKRGGRWLVSSVSDSFQPPTSASAP